MKQILFIFNFLLALLVFASCNPQGEDPAGLFGIKELPDVNINLLSVNPSNSFIEINQTKQLHASGGTEPYTFTLVSGGGILSGQGLYSAPSYQTNAVIKITDSKKKEAFGTVVVNIPITLTPTSITIGTNSSTNFAALGGIPPYSYSVVNGQGSMGATSGIYSSTGVSPGTAIVKVTDSSGREAFAAVTVNSSLAISPANITLGKGEQLQLNSSGGSLPYTYSIIAGGGTINSGTGLYSAPNTTGTVFIRVSDANGLSADAIINLVNKPKISSQWDKLATNSTLQFSASEGTAPYVFSIISGPGSIDTNTGLYTSGLDVSTVTVRVTDANGYVDDKTVEVFIPSIVAPGLRHTCALSFSSSTSSQAKCWGLSKLDTGTHSMLGTSDSRFYVGDEISDMGDNLNYVDMGTGIEIQDFVYGWEALCALTTTNQLRCFGNNGNGTFLQGHGNAIGIYDDTMGDGLQPVDLGTGRSLNPNLSFTDAFSLLNSTACAILDDDSLKCWGYGNYGKRGSGDTGNYGNNSAHSINALSAINIGGESPIQVSTGFYHTCVLVASGKVKCWGYNNYGELGYEDTVYRGDQPGNKPETFGFVNLGTGKTAKSIHAGYHITCAILNDDSLKCWGRNDRGDLGLEDNIHRGNAPGTMGDNLAAIDLGFGKTVKKVVNTLRTTCALLNDNTVKCWGDNSYGSAGAGHTNLIGRYMGEMGDNLPTVNFGENRTVQDIWRKHWGICAKLDNNQIKCFGYNQTALAGVGHLLDIGKSTYAMGDNLPAVNLGTGREALKVEGGAYATCALLDNKKLKCWGYHYRGDGASIIGDSPGEVTPSLPGINPGTNRYFLDIKSTNWSTCGRTNFGEIICWGRNLNGSLGIETGSYQGYSQATSGDNFIKVKLGTGRTAVDLSVGEDHVCALLDNQKVKCWGSNNFGQTGIGMSVGWTTNSMGDNLSSVNLGTVSYPIKVGAGYRHSCALFANGKVKCWGDNLYGTLGLGDTVNRTDPATQMGDNLPFVNLGTGKVAKDMCVGAYVNCAILTDNSLRCWGYQGRNGKGEPTHVGDEPSDMGDNMVKVNLGANFTVKKVSCFSHVCALSTAGEVKCWGHTGNGRLGTGYNISGEIGDITSELGEGMVAAKLGTNHKAVDVVAGRDHTCAVLDNNKMKCWGYNGYGQLGIGHRTDMGLSPLTVGDNLPYVEFK